MWYYYHFLNLFILSTIIFLSLVFIPKVKTIRNVDSKLKNNDKSKPAIESVVYFDKMYDSPKENTKTKAHLKTTLTK